MKNKTANGRQDKPKGRKRAGAAAGGGGPSETTFTALLPIYLREMGETPLLDKDTEARLARELQEAREGLAELAIKLPARCREYVLAGDLDGPGRGREWPLDQLERFYLNLLRYRKENDSARMVAAVQEAKVLKQRVDSARDALILANLRLVAHIAKKYLNHGLSYMDLIQEGNIGLMKAVEKFEHKRGNRFSTYAYWWIKQALARAIASKARTIRIPVHVGEKIKKIKRVTQEMGTRLGRKPTAPEIAKKLKMPIDRVEEILVLLQDAQSFDDLGPFGDDKGQAHRVRDPEARSPIEGALDSELRAKVMATLEVLDPREEEVIRLRFGIGRERSHTLGEIGYRINLSRERVRQIEEAALGKIQKAETSGDLEKLHGKGA